MATNSKVHSFQIETFPDAWTRLPMHLPQSHPLAIGPIREVHLLPYDWTWINNAYIIIQKGSCFCQTEGQEIHGGKLVEWAGPGLGTCLHISFDENSKLFLAAEIPRSLSRSDISELDIVTENGVRFTTSRDGQLHEFVTPEPIDFSYSCPSPTSHGCPASQLGALQPRQMYDDGLTCVVM